MPGTKNHGLDYRGWRWSAGTSRQSGAAPATSPRHLAAVVFDPAPFNHHLGDHAVIDDEAAAPKSKLADKGYDSDAIRADLESRGTEPVIPTKSNRKVRRTVCRETYAPRSRIERFFNKLKHSRRAATRYDKLTNSFLGFVQLATIRI